MYLNKLFINNLKITIMKKLFIILSFGLFIFQSNAQLRVNTDGSLSTGYNGYGDLNMGSSGYTSNGTVWG